MRIRHRIPTVFSLYMVDVFCCALGCVILIWLDNLQASEEKLAAADKREAETVAKLRDAENLTSLTAKQRDAAEQRAGRTSDRLNETEQDRNAAYLMLADLNARLEQMEKEKNDLQKKLATALVQGQQLDEKLRDSTGRIAALEKDLSARSQELKNAQALTKTAQATASLVPNLRSELQTTQDKLAKEATLAESLEKDIAKRTKELTDLNSTLAEMSDLKAALEKSVAARDKDLAAALVYKSKWEASEERAQLLEKQLTERQKEMALAELNAGVQLAKEKKTWLDELARVKNASDARFAGIQLTGKRVVFLVDMSGSMDLVDETTPAPSKWLGVRETLVKIMRSLPELEKFQVILFSEKASFLFGGDGAFINYDPRLSSDRIFKALSEIKPNSGTNMYSAMDAAFKLRASGLDTIYLLSDGLPNMGEGLRPEDSARMTEMQRGEVLGKFIRQKLKTDWNRPLARMPLVRINTVGFFYESPDVGAFLWALARENDGSFVGMSRP